MNYFKKKYKFSRIHIYSYNIKSVKTYLFFIYLIININKMNSLLSLSEKNESLFPKLTWE